MNWQDPAGPWQTAMRRRVHLRRVGLAGLALVWIVVSAVVLYTFARITRMPGVARGELWLVWLPTLIFIAVFTVQVRLQRGRERRLSSILRGVPEADGLICPACQTSLVGLPAEGACQCCKVPYTHERVRDYWEAYPFATTPPERWDQRSRDASTTAGKRRSWRIVLVGFGILVVIAASIACSMYILGGTVLGAILRHAPIAIPFVLLISGFRVMASGLRRVGDSRHCTRCDYQQAPEGAPSPQCPECGAVWSNRSGIVLGRRPPGSKQRIRGGVLLVAAGLLSSALPLLPALAGRGWEVKLFPTGMLVEQIVRSRASDDHEWAELYARVLTPAQELRLAAGLLDKRLAEGHFSRDAGAWYSKALAAGRIPRALRERYYREMFSAWIVAPQHVRAGEPFTVTLGSKLAHDSSRPPGVHEVVCFGGFQVGSSDTPLARRTQTDYASILDDLKYKPTVELVAEAAGPLQIRAVFWFGVGAGVIGRIEWQADGTPAIPGKTDWLERVVVEHAVEVLP